jgi:hypothetical protein
MVSLIKDKPPTNSLVDIIQASSSGEPEDYSKRSLRVVKYDFPSKFELGRMTLLPQQLWFVGWPGM